MPECIYCPNPPDSAEHWLPRSLGTFGPLQVLNDKICDDCNQALGREIDTEFARVGPEAILRAGLGVVTLSHPQWHGRMAMKKRPSPRRMACLVAQWRDSGQSQASFARQHRIPTWTFWYWCHKLSSDLAPAESSAPNAFVPVHVTTEPAPSTVEIVLAGGERIHLRLGASTELVQAAVAALRATC